MTKRILLSLIIGVVALQMSACSMSRSRQLERVAKDWCLTIRASQVLPVYPLTEDIQPGDVFVVQTPISKQTEIYNDRGFLPLDQLVTRLPNLDYTTFYKDAYWKGTYASIAHERPGSLNQDNTKVRVEAPRSAFPTYNFSVKRGGGLQLAIPIQGIPVGLGLMGASRATGTVTIKDAYTYGIDGESLVRRLHKWWNLSPDVQRTLRAIVEQTDKDIYLRVVSRVYLTGSIVVGLTNLDAVGGGAEVGVPPKIELPSLSETEPEKVEASVEAYQGVLNSLSNLLSKRGPILPGGSVRFVHASQRSVTISQEFDRPLVIGYRGLDVKVFKDGRLSAPIPSFSVISGELGASDFKAIAWSYNDLSECYIDWLRKEGSREKMVDWLKQENQNINPADLIHSDKHLRLLKRAAKRFGFSCS